MSRLMGVRGFIERLEQIQEESRLDGSAFANHMGYFGSFRMKLGKMFATTSKAEYRFDFHELALDDEDIQYFIDKYSEECRRLTLEAEAKAIEQAKKRIKEAKEEIKRIKDEQ